MFAFVRFGNTEVKVTEGDVVEVFRTGAKAGEKLELSPILCYDGKKIITDAKKLAAIKVMCEVVEEKKGEKIYCFHKQPKTGFKKGIGHRDRLLVVKVEKIIGASSHSS